MSTTERVWENYSGVIRQIVDGKPGEWIATVSELSDARLIAAAPEMLALVAKIGARLHGDEQSERGTLIREARALLAKVEGKS